MTKMTIKEIAALAGVSSAAVSRYLNGGYVSQEKKERIRKVIEETGYRPSAQARTLRTKRAYLIGVVAPKLSSESIARITDGIGQVLGEKGYQMLLAVTRNQADKELDYMRLFENYPVDGMILIGTVISKKHKDFLKESNVPVVVIGQSVRETSCIYHDDYGAAKALAKSLVSTGREKIAYIGAIREDQAVGKDRENGFRDGLTSCGLELPQELYREAQFTVDSGYEQALSLLEQQRSIDIISCATDTMAAGALRAVREKGLDGRIRITGFGDNKFLKAAVSDRITTVHFYYKTSGMKGAEMLIDIIETGKQVSMSVKLGFQIVNE